MKKIAFAIAFAFLASTSFAQLVNKPAVIRIKQAPKPVEAPQPAVVSYSEERTDLHVVYAQILENGDTLLTVNLPEVDIDLMQRYNQIIETRSGRRLAVNVKKVYPYALIAREMLHEYDSLLAKESSSSARRELMSQITILSIKLYTNTIIFCIIVCSALFSIICRANICYMV